MYKFVYLLEFFVGFNEHRLVSGLDRFSGRLMHFDMADTSINNSSSPRLHISQQLAFPMFPQYSFRVQQAQIGIIDQHMESLHNGQLARQCRNPYNAADMVQKFFHRQLHYLL